MTDLAERFPNASQTFLRLNGLAPATSTLLHPKPAPAATVVERRPRARALGKKKDDGSNTVRFLVRVTSFRVRLLDEDNLCEKYHVDCCRYAGVLPDDTPEQTRIEVRQEKVRSKEQERIEITITKLP